MSLSAAMEAAVDSAFTALGDLVVNATLSNSSVSGYSFATGALTEVESTVTVQAVLYSKELPSGEGFSQRAVVKNEGYTYDVYDTLTIGSDVYRITNSIDHTFAIELTLVKER